MPCSIQLDQNSAPHRASCFKYCNMWSTHSNFLSTVEQVWNAPSHGSMMFKILQKVRKLRKALRPIKQTYSGTLQKVDELRTELTRIQDDLALHPTDRNLQRREHEMKEDFQHWSRAAISLMNQRTRENWLLHGDANTKVFHQSLQRQHYQNQIYSITDQEGNIITNYKEVKEHFRDYYINLVGKVTPTDHGIDPLVVAEGRVLDVEQQLQLITEVTDDMIRQALWSIPEDKIPGPYGYGSCFYKAAWDIVGKDFCRAVKSFFS